MGRGSGGGSRLDLSMVLPVSPHSLDGKNQIPQPLSSCPSHSEDGPSVRTGRVMAERTHGQTTFGTLYVTLSSPYVHHRVVSWCCEASTVTGGLATVHPVITRQQAPSRQHQMPRHSHNQPENNKGRRRSAKVKEAEDREEGDERRWRREEGEEQARSEGGRKGGGQRVEGTAGSLRALLTVPCRESSDLLSPSLAFPPGLSVSSVDSSQWPG